MNRSILPCLLSALLIVAGITAARGQVPAPSSATATTPNAAAPGPDAAAQNKFLAPFIDDQTVLVAHLDFAQVDTAVIEKYVSSLLDDAKMPAGSEPRQALAQARTAADVVLARFKQLGGRHVYAVVAHPDIWPHMQPQAFIVKIEPGGNIAMMKEFLTATLHEGGIVDDKPTPASLADGSGEVVQLRDDVLFVGQDAALKRLQSLKPVERTDLQLQASAPLEVVAALTADERRALRELMPTLPVEVGGGSTEILTREGTQVRLTLALPPELKLQLSIKHTDAALVHFSNGELRSSEPEVDTLIEHLRDMLLENPDLSEGLNDPALKPHATEIKVLIKEILTPFGGTLTIDDKQIRRLMPLLTRSLEMSRELAMRTTSAANIRGLLQACMVYAADHKESLPESLDVLVKEGIVAPKQLVNPADGKAYGYRPAVLKNIDATNTPLIWETTEGDGGRNVGYADGHVEWVASKKILDDQIKAADAAKAKQVPPKLP